MPESISFYADQHLPQPVVEGLKRRGIDVLTAQEAGRCGASDPDQLAFADHSARVLITFDPDFIVLHRAGAKHAGIAWCPATKYSIGELIQVLLLLHAIMLPDDMRGHLEYL